MGWLLGSWAGQLLLGGVAFLGLWAGFALHFEHKGAAKLAAKIEERTTANVAKANLARKSVEALPVEQLNDRYRRD